LHIASGSCKNNHVLGLVCVGKLVITEKIPKIISGVYDTSQFARELL